MTITAVTPESRTQPAPAAAAHACDAGSHRNRDSASHLRVSSPAGPRPPGSRRRRSSRFWRQPACPCSCYSRSAVVPAPARLLARTARLALAFAVVALVSALASATPGIAMVGLYQQGTGWVFVAGLVGCWALGTRLGERARQLLALLIIFSAIANSAIAILQLTVGLGRISLPLYDGTSADGLQANPFELGALVAAALALLAGRFKSSPREWYLPVVAVTVGAGVCGQRLPLLLIAGVLAWSAWQTYSRRHRARQDGPGFPRHVRRTVGFSVLSIAGVAVGSLIASASNATGSIARVAGSTSEETFGQRLMAWREGLRAFTHHFLIGAGPGQIQVRYVLSVPAFVR